MKKRIVSTLFALVALIGCLPISLYAAEGESLVLTIGTAEELSAFANAVNGGDSFEGKTVKLIADIDLANTEWQPIGSGTAIFAGEFNGNGKTIRNLTNTEDVPIKGLFSKLEKSYIHNLTLEGVKFYGTADDMIVGALSAEFLSYNVVKNVNIVSPEYKLNTSNALIGGLAGKVESNYIKNCNVTDAVMNITSSGTSTIGGMIACGVGNNASIERFPYSEKIDTVDHRDGFIWNYVDSHTAINYSALSGNIIFGGFIGSDTLESTDNYAKNCSAYPQISSTDDVGIHTVGGFMGIQIGNYDMNALLNCSSSGSLYFMRRNTESSYGGFLGCVGGNSSGVSGCNTEVAINVLRGNVGGFVGEILQSRENAYAFDNCNVNDVMLLIDRGKVGGFAGNIEHSTDGSAINVSFVKCTTKASFTVGNSDHATSGEFAAAISDLQNKTHTGGLIVIKDCKANGNLIDPYQLPIVDGGMIDINKIPVAKIGDTKYYSLQEAIDAAASGNIIKMVSDVNESNIIIASDDNVILDLCEFTLTGNITVCGKSVIKNGRIINKEFLFGIKAEGDAAELTAEDINLTSQSDGIVVIGGKASILSGNYETTNKDGVAITCDATGRLSVSGGSYSTDPSSYLSEGYESTLSEDKYVVSAKKHPIEWAGKTLLFENNIMLKYIFTLNTASEAIDPELYLQVWTEEEYAKLNIGDAQPDENAVPGKIYTEFVKNGDYWTVTTDGIPAKKMGDLMYVRAYIEIEGVKYFTDIIEYSPAVYAENKYNAPETTPELRKLVVSLVNYGAAAQRHFKYKTDLPMNSFLMADERLSDYVPEMTRPLLSVDPNKLAGTPDSEFYTKIAKSLIVEGTISIKIVVKTKETIDLEKMRSAVLLYWSAEDYNTISTLDMDNATVCAAIEKNGDYFTGEISGFAAKDWGNTGYYCVYIKDDNGTEHYSDLIAYSVHRYAANKLEDEGIGELAEYLTIYSHTAQQYFDKKDN